LDSRASTRPVQEGADYRGSVPQVDLQKDALKRAKCREVYEEQASGKNTGRPQLEGCLKSLREGDTLVVWRLDRLGRNLADLVRLIAELEHGKINFESLTEKIEIVSPAGRLVFHVFAAVLKRAA
jgi:DNA invertase Pin-like site-specific DNA recombinase